MISVFKFLNSFANRYRWLDAAAVFCGEYLPYFLVIFLFVFSLLLKRLSLLVFPLAAGVFARFVVNEIIYFVYKARRPAEIKETKVLIVPPHNTSFPSGHASLFFAVSFSLLFYNLPMAIVFLFFTVLMAMARVFSGIHWFSDIVAGVLVGAFSALIINSLKPWILSNLLS